MSPKRFRKAEQTVTVARAADRGRRAAPVRMRKEETSEARRRHFGSSGNSPSGRCPFTECSSRTTTTSQ